MKKISLALLCLFLYGCQTFPDATLLDPTKSTKEIVIDQDLMKDCEALKLLPYPSTFEEELRIRATNIQIYVDCKFQNAGKKKLIEKYILKKESK